MALSNRDCRHGRQIGKCADCALDHMEMAADAEARRVDELTALRKQDTELIRQMLDALELPGTKTIKCCSSVLRQQEQAVRGWMASHEPPRKVAASVGKKKSKEQ